MLTVPVENLDMHGSGWEDLNIGEHHIELTSGNIFIEQDADSTRTFNATSAVASIDPEHLYFGACGSWQDVLV